MWCEKVRDLEPLFSNLASWRLTLTSWSRCSSASIRASSWEMSFVLGCLITVVTTAGRGHPHPGSQTQLIFRKIAIWLSKNYQKLEKKNFKCPKFFFKNLQWHLKKSKIFWKFLDIQMAILWRVRYSPRIRKTHCRYLNTLQFNFHINTDFALLITHYALSLRITYPW